MKATRSGGVDILWWTCMIWHGWICCWAAWNVFMTCVRWAYNGARIGQVWGARGLTLDEASCLELMVNVDWKIWEPKSQVGLRDQIQQEGI